jgi:hypothetical protein
MNKKGQIGADIAYFAVILIVLIVIAPILLQIVTSSTRGISAGLNNSGNNQSANVVAAIENKFVGFYDFLIIASMLASVVMLIITAFLVAVHPIFILFYIIICFVTMLIMPQIIQTAQKIWEAPYINDVTTYLPATQFIMDYYGLILLAVMIISGIIMYSKLNGGQNNLSP